MASSSMKTLSSRKPQWFSNLYGFEEGSSFAKNRDMFFMDGDVLVCPSAPEVSFFFFFFFFFLVYEDVSIIQDQNIYNSINPIFYHLKISQRQKVGAFETPSLGELQSRLQMPPMLLTLPMAVVVVSGSIICLLPRELSRSY